MPKIDIDKEIDEDYELFINHYYYIPKNEYIKIRFILKKEKKILLKFLSNQYKNKKLII
jgi:hypothetical protein